MSETLVIHARIATMRGGKYSMIEDGALATSEGRIAWVGPMAELDRQKLPARADPKMLDAEGALVTPGLIDAHTHLVYGGNRAAEFEKRLEGASYEDIAKAGGGIAATVKATRAASDMELRDQSLARLRRLMAGGVTTVEIKSGYGLDMHTEMRILRVAKLLAKDIPVRIRTTFLGAHALPPEFAGRADDYIELLCKEMIPAIALDGAADAVDCFCEGIGFTPEQTQRVFSAAHEMGLRVKLHADQLSDLGGAALAARNRALSADHLEHTNEEGVLAMAKSGTVAMLLPGAYLFLRETKLPPIELLRRHNVPMAIATDCNPGTSPYTSLPLMMNLACVLFRLTPEEALAGATAHAARALGLEEEAGSLEPGKSADFVVWNAEEPAELAYTGGVRPRAAYFAGTYRT
ncbi:imidazolonepropionase [Usitatibacter palustris]|uniref:Imidazolonepropionase n=1 Tax=Usitatibacter palustris TaxID=2732487 RepID=A0A6M4H8N9_9PROT|nr:imidazolonepropionase [Usitatibacter palustris]QJR14744.1 Imidazolonepropionase [Usitatibacter palustris]